MIKFNGKLEVKLFLGAVLVTTPQLAAVQVTKRSAVMFEKLGVPIVGLIENMSHIMCNSCHKNIHLFGNNAEALIKELRIQHSAHLPLEEAISNSADKGIPIVIERPDSLVAKMYTNFAKDLINFCK